MAQASKVSWNSEIWVLLLLLLLGILVWVILADWLLGTAPGTILRNSGSKSLLKEFNLLIKFLEELIIFFSPKLSPRIWGPALWWLQIQMVPYHLLSFSSSFKKVLSHFLGWSLYSYSSLYHSQAEFLSDPSFWSGLSLHSPLKHHHILTRMQDPFLPWVHETQGFLLGECLLRLNPTLTDFLFSFAIGSEGPGQSKQCSALCWQSWRWSTGLLTCSEPPSIHSWPRLKNRDILGVIHLKSKRSVMICYSLHPEKHTSDIFSQSTNYHNS